MEKRTKKLLAILFIVSTIYCVEATQGLAQFLDSDMLRSRLYNTVAGNDISLEFLRILFGSVGGLNGNNVIMSEIFRKFNMGVLTVVSITIGYTVILSVIGTSQDGSGAFSTRVSPWTLFRTVTGVSIMVPTTSGYSVIQIMVMKVVLMGVALANTAWVGALTYHNAMGGLQPSTASALPAVTNNAEANADVLARYFSDVYEKLWAKYDTMCGSDTNCSVSVQVLVSQPTRSTNNLKYIVTRQSDLREECFSLAAPIPNGLTGTNLTTALTNIRSLMIGPTARLLSLVVYNYRNPLPAALPAGIGGSSVPPTAWELSHSAHDDDWSQTPTNIAAIRTASQARLRQLSRTIADASQTLALTYEALSPTFMPSSSSFSSNTWYNDARQSGWLSAGMYYSYFLNNATPTSMSNTTFTMSYSSTYTPATLSVMPNSFGGAQATSSTTPTQTTLGNLSQASLDAIYYPLTIGSVPAPSTITSTVFGQQLTTLFASGGRASSTSLAGQVRTELTRVDTQILEKLREFDRYCPPSKGHRGTPAAYHLIPALSGKLPSSDTAWIFGVDVAKPITNLAFMLRTVILQLIGLKQGYRVPAGSGRPAVTCNFLGQNQRLQSYMNYEGCFFEGSLMHSVLFPDQHVNPIAMIQSLGQTMIRESITYYKDTIADLFIEIKSLADQYFAATTVVNATAVGIEAGTYGTIAAGVGAAAATTAEIIVTGLKMGYNGTKVALEMFVPLGTSVAAMIFVLGIIMGVYMPMLPFLLFLFGVIAWLMSVVEAMVAAPLVALGVTHPEGHDILGKAEQAMMLLLGVFIRPITMLFGMMMAIVVSQLLLKLFHLGFLQIIMVFFSNNAASNPGLYTLSVILIGSLLVYIYVLMNVIEQSFSLVYVIPERILRWVGGPQDQTGVGQLAEQAKGEFQQASGQAAQGASSSTAGPNLAATSGDIQRPEDDSAEKGEDKKGGDGGGGDGGGGGGDGNAAGGKSGGGEGGGGKGNAAGGNAAPGGGAGGGGNAAGGNAAPGGGGAGGGGAAGGGVGQGNAAAGGGQGNPAGGSEEGDNAGGANNDSGGGGDDSGGANNDSGGGGDDSGGANNDSGGGNDGGSTDSET